MDAELSKAAALKGNEWEYWLLYKAKDAKHPYQFISHFMCSLEGCHGGVPSGWWKMPLSMDASASAYQVMSYFLLDVELGRKTNLVNRCVDPDQIVDLYQIMLDEFMGVVDKYLEEEIAVLVGDMLSRKLFQSVYMPLVYGKTEFSARSDIMRGGGFSLLTRRDAYVLTHALYRFWEERFPGVKNLMSLVNEIGWLCSFLDRPVRYHGEHITTVQDYIRCERVTTSVYNSTLKRTHSITQ